MAFVHEQSCECTKLELDLFSIPPTQTSMEQGSWVEYHPLTTVADYSPINFDISGIGEDYIDFANTMLYVKVKITANDGTNLTADAAVGPRIYFYTVCFHKWTFLSMERSSPLPLILIRIGPCLKRF